MRGQSSPGKAKSTSSRRHQQRLCTLLHAEPLKSSPSHGSGSGARPAGRGSGESGVILCRKHTLRPAPRGRWLASPCTSRRLPATLRTCRARVSPAPHSPRPRLQEQRTRPWSLPHPRVRASGGATRGRVLISGDACALPQPPSYRPLGGAVLPATRPTHLLSWLLQPAVKVKAEPGVSTGSGRCPRCSRVGPAAPDLERKESGAENADTGRGARTEGMGNRSRCSSLTSRGTLPR